MISKERTVDFIDMSMSSGISLYRNVRSSCGEAVNGKVMPEKLRSVVEPLLRTTSTFVMMTSLLAN